MRVIGLDTPESVKPGTPVECYALQASAEAKLLLPVGSAIRLQADPTQATRDRYGRLLAHVWLADATLFAERMIRGGFGIHDIYEGVPSIYASRLAAAEAAARGALRGLWSPTTCAGNESHSGAVGGRSTDVAGGDDLAPGLIQPARRPDPLRAPAGCTGWRRDRAVAAWSAP